MTKKVTENDIMRFLIFTYGPMHEKYIRKMRKGMRFMVKVMYYKDMPVKDDNSTVKNWKRPRLTYEQKGWYSRITQDWCRERGGLSNGVDFIHYEIPVDDERYIAVAKVKQGTKLSKALGEFGFVVCE